MRFERRPNSDDSHQLQRFVAPETAETDLVVIGYQPCRATFVASDIEVEGAKLAR